MSWPLSQDYNEAVQTPAVSFADPELRSGEVQVNALGLPLPRSGNFADVYQVQCPHAAWAVKCFTRQVAGQRERYSEVSKHLQAVKLPFTVDFQYLEQGIRVHKQWYPILKMRWVEGLLLNAFVRDNLDKPALLYQLAQIWVRMARRLREAKVAHADLQHGNVLLVPGSKTQSLAVKLIDYDGTWVPALAGSKSGEVGHPNYQHPQRLREGTCNPEVDRFPELVVATALRALALGGKPLWERHDNGDNLLFKEPDLCEPGKSALFAELRGMSDPLLQTLVGKLEAAAQAKLEETPLLEELLADERRPAKGKAAAAAAPGMDWSFTSEEDRPRVRRRQRGGMRVGAWLAAGSVLMALTLGGLYFALRGGEGRTDPLAQHRPRETHAEAPTTSRGPAGTTAKHAGHGSGNDPEKRPTDPKPPDTRKRTYPDRRPPDPPPAEPPAVAGRPPGVFEVLAGTPNLLIHAAPGGKKWELSEVVAPDVSKPRQEFVGHTGAVTCVALTPDARLALSGSEDRTLRLWDVQTGEPLKTLKGHAYRVVAVAISADGKRGLSADMSPRARLWDLDTGKEIDHHLDHPGGVSSVAFSPDGKRVLCGLGHGVRADRDSVFRWDAESGAALGSFKGHTHAVLCLAFSPDGKSMASGSADESVRLWKDRPEAEAASFPVLKAPVRQVACSPNGHVLLGTAGAVTHFWNLATEKSTTKEDPDSDDVSACFLPDGRVLWVGRKGEQFNVRTVPDPEKSTTVAVKPPPPSPPPPPRRKPRPETRHAVPDLDALEAAKAELEKVVKAKTGSPERLTKLSAVAQGALRPDVKYVVLEELRDAAAQKGDLEKALAYAGRISKDYAIHPLDAKAEALERVSKTTKSAVLHQAVAEQALRAIPWAESEEAFDPASRLVQVAKSAAAKVGKSSLIKAADARDVEVTGARLDLPAMQEALGVLAAKPDDPEANLKVGRFRCLYQDDWDEGLPRLARGSDQALKDLALKDLANPVETAARRELGDGWWEAAEKDLPAARQAFERRAVHWYERALPKLTTGAGEVKKRIETFREEVPENRDPWRHLDLSEGTIERDRVHLAPDRDGEKCLFTRRRYTGGIEITVEAKTKKNNIRITAGDGALALFNWEGTNGGMSFYRPDKPDADGRGRVRGSAIDHKNRNLDPNKWYTLRWQLTPGGMKVWVNDEKVFEKEEPYDLTAPQPVGVCSYDSPIDVKSVVVKPVFPTPGTDQK